MSFSFKILCSTDSFSLVPVNCLNYLRKLFLIAFFLIWKSDIFLLLDWLLPKAKKLNLFFHLTNSWWGVQMDSCLSKKNITDLTETSTHLADVTFLLITTMLIGHLREYKIQRYTIHKLFQVFAWGLSVIKENIYKFV